MDFSSPSSGNEENIEQSNLGAEFKSAVPLQLDHVFTLLQALREKQSDNHEEPTQSVL